MTELFGTDGIRGTVGEWPLVPEFFLEIGKSAGRILVSDNTNSNIIVGRDTRSSGPMLQSALVSGLMASGVVAIDAEVIPTSGVAWLIKKMGAAAGAVISASHNPAEQNGVKFFSANGQKLTPDTERKIERMALAENGVEAKTRIPSCKIGRAINGGVLHELYIQALLSEHPNRFLEGLKIVLDCANGAASWIAPQVFDRAGARVIALNASPTGENINVKCGSEHIRRYPGEMGALIQHYQADFGLAFDGDADRVAFVDNAGTLIDGDYILGLLAHYLGGHGLLLANSVVTTTMRNAGLKTFVESSYVVEKLVELKSQNNQDGQFGLGGEQSGHVILLNDEFTTGDGIRTALYLMHAYLESGHKNMGGFTASVNKTPQIIASAHVGSGPRIDRNDLDSLEKQIIDATPGINRINLRYSGTEPIFRVMLESDHESTEEDLAKIAYELCQNAQKTSGVKDGTIDILNCARGGLISL
jgi:phosphoglucosamine mutase